MKMDAEKITYELVKRAVRNLRKVRRSRSKEYRSTSLQAKV